MREKLDGADDAFGTGGWYIYAVTAVVLRSAADVPTIDAMDCPRASIRWCLVYEHFCTRRCKGLLIEVVNSMQLSIGG